MPIKLNPEKKQAIKNQLKDFGLNPRDWTCVPPILGKSFSLKHVNDKNLSIRGRIYEDKRSQSYYVDYLMMC